MERSASDEWLILRHDAASSSGRTTPCTATVTPEPGRLPPPDADDPPDVPAEVSLSPRDATDATAEAAGAMPLAMPEFGGAVPHRIGAIGDRTVYIVVDTNTNVTSTPFDSSEGAVQHARGLGAPFAVFEARQILRGAPAGNIDDVATWRDTEPSRASLGSGAAHAESRRFILR